MMEELKPTEKRHVYDLLQDAGMDVSDWANYKRPTIPAANPKYCYNWAFIQDDLVVLCLWLEQMKEDGHGLYQELNYREINATPRLWKPMQRKRAGEMDDAFQAANNRKLPIRVIIVDGPPLEEREEGVSPVQARSLDPEPWHIESYDDDGNCVIRRGPPQYNLDTSSGDHRLARIAYNSSGWERPTGDAAKQEAGGTYNAQNKFGHEDWLFREKWQIDGWRYAFIEGFNTKNQTYAGKNLDITLYTIDPNRKARLIATINQVEGLTESQAQDAVRVFKAKGWFDTMQQEISAIGGNAEALVSTDWAPHILNVRFKVKDVDLYPAETYLEDTQWLKDRHRYMLYKFDHNERETVEKAVARRRGTHDAPEVRKLFRKGTKPVEFTPEHQKIQAKLVDELRKTYPAESIICEEDYVDVRVETSEEVIYYEIKTDLDPRSVIRQAMGQLLEYAYYPPRKGRQPNELVIVGRGELTKQNAEYLSRLGNEFNLPLSYFQVEV
ncbi:MAG: hypothetical protein EA353_11980 [Puniceicoccaceae bacterium]|nr:MAG: hypothetical protein EA353_11980 [Puniceicoccaceae bacterium]